MRSIEWDHFASASIPQSFFSRQAFPSKRKFLEIMSTNVTGTHPREPWRNVCADELTNLFAICPWSKEIKLLADFDRDSQHVISCQQGCYRTCGKLHPLRSCSGVIQSHIPSEAKRRESRKKIFPPVERSSRERSEIPRTFAR